MATFEDKNRLDFLKKWGSMASAAIKRPNIHISVTTGASLFKAMDVYNICRKGPKLFSPDGIIVYEADFIYTERDLELEKVHSELFVFYTQTTDTLYYTEKYLEVLDQELCTTYSSMTPLVTL